MLTPCGTKKNTQIDIIGEAQSVNTFPPLIIGVVLSQLVLILIIIIVLLDGEVAAAF